MKHKRCGGEIKESWKKYYTDEKGKRHPALYCMKCKKEILGNREIKKIF